MVEEAVWSGILAESTFRLKIYPVSFSDLGCSNEVQNFLYLSQSFAKEKITEGMCTRLCSRKEPY